MDLFPRLRDRPDRTALVCADGELTYGELDAVTSGVAARLGGARRVAVWATPTLATCVAVVAALRAGVPAIPLNPRVGSGELAHVVGDGAPGLVLADRGDELPPELAGVPRLDVLTDPGAPATPDRAGAGRVGAGRVGPDRSGPDGAETGRADTGGGSGADVGPEAAALIVYTSGTTGPPKGVVLPRRAIASNLDALAVAWEWTDRDVLAHALPLFHVHGLVVGVVGPLRLGGTVRHLGRFTPDGVAAAFTEHGASMLFGVPTMYARLAAEAEARPAIAAALRRHDGSDGAGGPMGPRLLVSGSAALPATVHERVRSLTGQEVVERYGMTETLMNTAVRASGDRRPAYVGPAVDGVEVRIVDDAGAVIGSRDDETIGEIEVRGPNVFTEYLNRPDATAAAFRDGWFRTGDVAAIAPDGYVRIVGRKATDLIKSGGFKIGAGEIENALLAHAAVAEVAVTGEPDDDLGERVVAWVVPAAGAAPTADELAAHVASTLAPHKRPRAVHFLESLPRNDLGKIVKGRLPR